MANITKLCIQSKLHYAYNFNKLWWRSLCCNSRDNDASGDCSGNPTLYDCRKISYGLPENNICPPFGVFSDIPSGVFRETQGETLGMGAAKCGSCYPNPEYFAYHNMSFFDFHFFLRMYRMPCPDSKRKPV